MENPPCPLRKPSRRRRLLGAALLALPLLWGGWRTAVRRMDFPRLIIRQPVPTLPPPLEPGDDLAVRAVAVSPDGRTVWSGGHLAFVKAGEKTFLSPAVLPICAWDAGMRRTVRVLKTPARNRFDEPGHTSPQTRHPRRQDPGRARRQHSPGMGHERPPLETPPSPPFDNPAPDEIQ